MLILTTVVLLTGYFSYRSDALTLNIIVAGYIYLLQPELRMRLQFDGLWKNNDFVRLWVGETISLFRFTNHSISPAACRGKFSTGHTPEMGALGFAQFIPWLLVGMFAGVWVDRLRRRPVMILADLGRAFLLGLIPLAAVLGHLQIGHLYTIGFLVGIGNVFFEIAYYAYLPSLITSEKLMEGNSKLTASASASEVAGPGLGGVLNSGDHGAFGDCFRTHSPFSLQPSP